MKAPVRSRSRSSFAAAASAASAVANLIAMASLPTSVLSDATPNPKPFKLEIVTAESDQRERHLAGKVGLGGGVAGRNKMRQFLEATLQGSSEYSWYETIHGYTFEINDITGKPHYVDVDDDSGELFQTDCIVGICNPAQYGLLPHTIDDEPQIMFKGGIAARRDRRIHLNKSLARIKDKKNLTGKKFGKFGSKFNTDGPGAGKKPDGDDEDNLNRRLRGNGDANLPVPTTGELPSRDLWSMQGSTSAYSGENGEQYVMNNLVLLIRWHDHQSRDLPSREELDILFNKKGGDETLAPTGSVRDCFLFNSYNQFDMNSILTEWIDVPLTEMQVGDDYYGMTGEVGRAIRMALDQIADDIDWSLFDKDGDGEIDSIAVIHSGYGAEAAENDCQTGNPPLSRIWSHKWNTDEDWYSPTGLLIWKYHISPALWGSCGSNIGRIGVICHETGHFLGAPDLYDGTGGNGIGSWGLMGNSWGFASDQYYPPMMSPWTRMLLGWLDPVMITSAGEYNAVATAAGPTNAFVIARPGVDSEYFIIENRQKTPGHFDAVLPNEGLLIWHIDDEGDFNQEGHPGLIDWPNSGAHYRVAVVQADGQFQLETAASRGDGGDVFHRSAIADEFGPDGIKKNGSLASSDVTTDWYQGGVVPSSIRIYDIGEGGLHSIPFKVEMEGQGGDTIKNVGLEEVAVDGPQQGQCAANGEACNLTEDCCKLCTCAKNKRRCRMLRKRQSKKNFNKRKKKTTKKKKRGGRKGEQRALRKRRISPLE